ncbi:MAG: hypothetical protein KJ607_01730 [Bacteroidetes bacterium]|nr:hypothetical protein [Bacteroidota bacterium]
MSFIQRPKNIDEKLIAMQRAYQKAEEVREQNNILAYSAETYNNLKSFLPVFEKEVDEVKTILNNQTETMWLKQKNLSLLRMYVTHFIQVFDFGVERGKFSIRDRAYYGLDVNNTAVPYVKSEADIILWVKKLISGENNRTADGQEAMNNPSIQEIKSIFDKYRALDREQSELKGVYSRGLSDIGILINEADELIRDIWDEVEFFYRKESAASRLKSCTEYGIVYSSENEEEINEATINNIEE